MENVTERASAEQVEGKTTKKLEAHRRRPVSNLAVFAGGAIAGSLALKIMGRHETANFVGWVPTILMLACTTRS
jgi:hypothetical protein